MPLECSILLVTARPATLLSIEKVLLEAEIVTRLTPIQNGPDTLEVVCHLRQSTESLGCRPRLILLDLNPNDANQISLLTAIKNDTCLSTIPVIILPDVVAGHHRGLRVPAELIRVRDLILSIVSHPPEADTDRQD